ncbi:uncharacterized protein LOC123511207 [Portunus trituberculatus]|uniref:uncharacterized protein LOC123511207 n=1 Tax=Portunus trituberculatus TaxID=210409 RepID=UPI001E1CB191|nr:uncharacterized protein LOC123511207 [Portunus trituberculatus]
MRKWWKWKLWWQMHPQAAGRWGQPSDPLLRIYRSKRGKTDKRYHAYNNLVTVSGLTNHVTFQTHERGGLLNPVLSDLPEERILCQQRDKVGSSDHHVVLTKIQLHVAREKAAPRTIWLWEQASWHDMRGALSATDWQTVLTGDAEEMAHALTSILATLQDRHVPHRTYLAKATNPQWFGFRCQIAAEAKYAAWRRYKQRPSLHNLAMHRAACPGVGDKTWWTLVKERQGVMRQESVPPLTRQDGTTASSGDDKAALLAKLFAEKMQVESPTHDPLQGYPGRQRTPSPQYPSPRSWWKKHSGNWTQGKPRARMESAPGHYRPISLLSVMGKVFEKLVAAVIWQHLDEHQLLSPHQFGFWPGRSTSDLLLLFSQEWQDILDEGLDTLVVALDIAGAYDRVWHAGLLTKLQAKGIDGGLLKLLEDYLQGRTLRTVVNGRTSSPTNIEASVPQGSAVEGQLRFEGEQLPLQEHIKILGVTMDRELR